MDYKNCAKCNEANLSDMRFCQNCGTEFMQADEPPPTVMAGFGANLQGGQMPLPNYQTPNFQQPSFQPPPPMNFQPQPNYQTAPQSGGGQIKKILLGIGSVLIGLVMLAMGGVKLYSAFSRPSYTPPTTVSPSPQNLYSNTSNSSNSSIYNSTTSTNRNSSSNNSSSTSSLLATGTYNGTGINVTHNKRGDFLLRIDSVDASGNVKGYFEASNGLYGSCTVKGTISSSKKLLLEGTFDNDDNLAINGTISGNTISAGYAVVDTNLKTQSGNFTITRR